MKFAAPSMARQSAVSQQPVRPRDAKKYLILIGVVLISWALGRSLSRLDFGLPIFLVGLVVSFTVFFRKESLLVLTPIAFCVPNFGLDLPGPWAVSIEDAFVLTVFAAMLARKIFRRESLISWNAPLVRPLLAFWAIAVISLGKTLLISPGTQTYIVKDLLRLTMLVLLYLSLVDVIRTKEHIRKVIRTLLILAVPMGMVSWYIYLTGSPFFYRILTLKPAILFYKTNFVRMISIAGTTSFTGMYYALILALAWTYPGLRTSRNRRLLRAGLMTLCASCLILTYNRGTWVGVLFGLACLMFIGRLSRKKVAIAVALSLGLTVLATAHVFTRFDVEEKARVVVELSRSSGQARLTRWISAVNVVLDQPLLGVGYNNYAFVYGRYSVEEQVARSYGSPHNMYVDIVTGVGLIGFAIFAFLLHRLWRLHLRNLREAEDPEIRDISQGLFLALTFFLGASCFDSFLFKPHHTTFIVFTLWALAAGIQGIHRRGERPEKEGQSG